MAGGVTISSNGMAGEEENNVSISSSPSIPLTEKSKLRFPRKKKNRMKMWTQMEKTEQLIGAAVVLLMLLPCSSAFSTVHAGAWCEMNKHTISTCIFL